MSHPLYICVILNKVADLQTLLKKKLHHSCFLVNVAKYLKTPFCMEHLWWLLLKIVEEFPGNTNLTSEGFLQKNLQEIAVEVLT